MEQSGIQFKVFIGNFDEKKEPTIDIKPYDLVKLFSYKKAVNACEDIEAPGVIIAADTIVSKDGKVLGKPKSKDDSYNMLSFLQDSEHIVFTGVTMINKNQDRSDVECFVDSTIVKMRKLTDAEILSYIDTDEPLDKAGSYAIQGKGALLIESIRGDYYNVMGLPLVKVYKQLKEFGAI